MNALKAGLSVFILFHLTTVIVLANPGSLLAHALSPLVNGYGSTFGLNTTWQFFSPDPGPKLLFQYEFVRKDGSIDPATYVWPPEAGNKSPFSNYQRLIYYPIRTTSSEERVEKFFIPWLCRQNPSAESVSLSIVAFEVPSMEKTVTESKKLPELARPKPSPAKTYVCPGASS